MGKWICGGMVDVVLMLDLGARDRGESSRLFGERKGHLGLVRRRVT